MLQALLILSLTDSVFGPPALIFSGTANAGPRTDAAARIQAAPEPGSGTWDDLVKDAVVDNFDENSSGSVDNAVELSHMGCETWEAIVLSFGRTTQYSSAFDAVYGFKPGLLWVGDSVGIDQALRQAAYREIEGCGLAGVREASQMGASPPVPADGVVTRIQAVPDPGSSDWDEGVKAVLLGEYDLDQSGYIDENGEVDAIDCEAWTALVLSFGSSSKYQTGLDQIYGFQDGYIWVGHALGFDDSQRARANRAIERCGLAGVRRRSDIRVTGGDLQALISGVPDPGSSEWDRTIMSILVNELDADGSGVIDTRDELGAMSCGDWRALVLGFGRTTQYSAAFDQIYGFREGYGWVGGQLGFSERLRDGAMAAIDDCGLRGVRTDGGLPPGPTPDDAPSPVASPAPLPSGALSGALMALPNPGTDRWDAQVKGLLVATYDQDGSGNLNKRAEVEAIDCGTWSGLVRGFGASTEYSGSFDRIYGFAPGYGWVGSSVGFDDEVRELAFFRIQACGLEGQR